MFVLEYEEDDEEDDEEKWKIWYFIRMKKNADQRKNRQTLQPCPTEDNNKFIHLCTHTVGYFIYKHHTVGLVLKVNPQLHCCYQTQSIKHTHQKISQYQRYFYYSGKKKCACIYYSKAKIC